MRGKLRQHWTLEHSTWGKCVQSPFLIYLPVYYSLLSSICLVWQLITVLTSRICTVNHHNFLANLAFRRTQKSPLGATSLLMLRLPGLVWGKGEGSCVLQRYMTGKSPFLHRKEAELGAVVRWWSSWYWNLIAWRPIHGFKLATFLDALRCLKTKPHLQ